MNTLKNKVSLIGNVGQPPKINVLEDGRKLARFSLATNEHFTNSKGEKVKITHWHHIIFWNGAADIVEQHVNQGTKLALEGKLVTRSWEDDSGIKQYRTEIVGRELLLL